MRTYEIRYAPVTSHLLRRHRWRTVVVFPPYGYRFAEQCARCNRIRVTNGLTGQRSWLTPEQLRVQEQINKMDSYYKGRLLEFMGD